MLVAQLLHWIGRALLYVVRWACLPLTLLLGLLPSSNGHESNGRESYASLDHLALNVVRPTTEWLNMGDWSSTTEFPVACSRLARRLFTAASLRKGASVLDVGCGSGDSLLLLLREYVPKTLHGVTSLSSHADRARFRSAHVAENTDAECVVDVVCDDAVRFVEKRSKDSAQRYDHIFALDCAYHFHLTRKRFIAASFDLLEPGGVLALQDLIAAHPYPTSDLQSRFVASPILARPTKTMSPIRKIKHHFMLYASQTPSRNIISAQEYVDQLEQAGFTDVRIEDTSHFVFPGFASFLKQLGRAEEAAWRGGGTMQLFGLRAFGSVVETWASGGDQGTIRSVTVTARKRKA